MMIDEGVDAKIHKVTAKRAVQKQSNYEEDDE